MMNPIQAILDQAPVIQPEAPRPLLLMRPPAPCFPIEALPPVLQSATRAIQATSQAPLGLCGQSVLAASALVVQSLVNVETLGGSIKPCSLFFISIAVSGERKSTVDAMALHPIRIHERRLRIMYESEYDTYRIDKLAYDAQVKQIEKDKKTSKDEKRDALNALGLPPPAPLEPILTCEEPTFEGLCRLLQQGQGSLGLFTDEGGAFIGGHAMRDDSHLCTISGLSKLWDGDTIKRIRSGEGNSLISGKRLSAHLMMQPEVAHGFLGNSLNKSQGLLARFLVCQPESTMGSRSFKQTDSSTARGLEAYETHMAELLNKPLAYDPLYRNELKPRTLHLSKDAKQALAGFHDAVEAELGSHGELHHISGFGAKLAEHTARLAGVMTAIQTPDASMVDESTMQNAIALARFYQAEAVRLSTVHEADEGILLAQKLLRWIETKWEHGFVSKACVQGIVPNTLRERKKLNMAFETLVDHGYLIQWEGVVRINNHNRKEAFKIVTH
jgi:hypothetical protein